MGVQRFQLRERGISVPSRVVQPGPLQDFGKVLGGLGDFLTKMDARLRKAQDDAIFSEKKSQYLSQIKDVELNVKTLGDADLIGPSFLKGVGEIEKSLLSDIEPSKELAADLSGFFQAERGARIPRMKQVEFDVRLGQTRATGTQTLFNLEKAIALADDPGEQELARGELENFFMTMAENQVFSAEEIQKMSADTERNIDYHSALESMREDPTSLLDRLLNRDLPNLTIKDRDRLWEQAVKRQAQNESKQDKALKDELDRNAGLVARGIQGGDVTTETLDFLGTNRFLDPDDWERLSLNLNKQIRGGGVSNKEVFNDYSRGVIDGTIGEQDILDENDLSTADQRTLIDQLATITSRDSQVASGRPKPFRIGWTTIKTSILRGMLEPITNEQKIKYDRAWVEWTERSAKLDPTDEAAHRELAQEMRTRFKTEQVVPRPLIIQDKPIHSSPSELIKAFNNQEISNTIYIQQLILWEERRKAILRQTKKEDPEEKEGFSFSNFFGGFFSTKESRRDE